MPDQTMIERVARALCVRDDEGSVDDEVCLGMNEVGPRWMAYADDVRAVLTAMREPTEAMNDAYFDVLENKPMAPDTVWPAMIDAALEDGR